GRNRVFGGGSPDIRLWNVGREQRDASHREYSRSLVIGNRGSRGYEVEGVCASGGSRLPMIEHGEKPWGTSKTSCRGPRSTPSPKGRSTTSNGYPEGVVRSTRGAPEKTLSCSVIYAAPPDSRNASWSIVNSNILPSFGGRRRTALPAASS